MFLSRDNFKTLATEFFLITKPLDYDDEGKTLAGYLDLWDKTDTAGRVNMFSNFIAAYGTALTEMGPHAEVIN